MTTGGIGEQFTLLTLTRGSGCGPWRRITGRWQFGEGWPYLELQGISDVSQARSALASLWLAEHDTQWCVWADDDIVVPTWERLIWLLETALENRTKLDLLCASYVPKRPRSEGMAVLFVDPEVVVGDGGGLVRVDACGFGLVAIKREVFERIALSLKPVRYPEVGGIRGWPFFLGMVGGDPADPDGLGRHLGEDFAFCRRANAVGCRLWCDTRLRIGHRGGYTYWWEDAGAELQRSATIKLQRSDYRTKERV